MLKKKLFVILLCFSVFVNSFSFTYAFEPVSGSALFSFAVNAVKLSAIASVFKVASDDVKEIAPSLLNRLYSSRSLSSVNDYIFKLFKSKTGKDLDFYDINDINFNLTKPERFSLYESIKEADLYYNGSYDVPDDSLFSSESPFPIHTSYDLKIFQPSWDQRSSVLDFSYYDKQVFSLYLSPPSSFDVPGGYDFLKILPSSYISLWKEKSGLSFIDTSFNAFAYTVGPSDVYDVVRNASFDPRYTFMTMQIQDNGSYVLTLLTPVSSPGLLSPPFFFANGTSAFSSGGRPHGVTTIEGIEYYYASTTASSKPITLRPFTGSILGSVSGLNYASGSYYIYDKSYNYSYFKNDAGRSVMIVHKGDSIYSDVKAVYFKNAAGSLITVGNASARTNLINSLNIENLTDYYVSSHDLYFGDFFKSALEPLKAKTFPDYSDSLELDLSFNVPSEWLPAVSDSDRIDYLNSNFKQLFNIAQGSQIASDGSVSIPNELLDVIDTVKTPELSGDVGDVVEPLPPVEVPEGLENVFEFIKGIFIPDKAFLSDRFGVLLDSVSKKFNIKALSDYVDNLGKVESVSPPRFEFMGANLIDLSFWEVTQIRKIIGFVLNLYLVLFNFRMIQKILLGHTTEKS